MSLPKVFDHELKLNRAREQLKELHDKSWDWFHSGKHHTVRYEPNPQAGTDILASAEQIPKDPFCLLIGECLHSMRSALDNLAYALAVSYTKPLPPAVAEKSEFPIFGNVNGQGAADFNKVRVRKIGGMNPLAQAEIERLQPYHRGNGYGLDPLWILHDLDRINKHRLLHVVVAQGIGLHAQFLPGSATDLARFHYEPVEGYLGMRLFSGPIETDTKIATTMQVPNKPRDYVGMDYEPMFEIRFTPGTVVDDDGVERILEGIYRHITREVLSKLTPFL